MKLTASAFTDVGKHRRRNEDRYLCLPDAGVFVVCDGVGGHAGGAEAAQAAVDRLSAVLKPICSMHRVNVDLDNRGDLVKGAFELANEAVMREARRLRYDEMCTTCAALVLFDTGTEAVALLAHVGDSRIYAMRGGRLLPLTADHAAADGRLTRVLGYQAKLEVELKAYILQPGDTFLVCSDGLHGMLSDQEIGTELNNKAPVEVVGKRLLQSALDHGGHDNATGIVVRL